MKHTIDWSWDDFLSLVVASAKRVCGPTSVTYFICHQSDPYLTYSFGADPFGRNFDRPIPSIILPYILFILTIRVKQLDFAFHKYINIAIVPLSYVHLRRRHNCSFRVPFRNDQVMLVELFCLESLSNVISGKVRQLSKAINTLDNRLDDVELFLAHMWLHQLLLWLIYFLSLEFHLFVFT